MKANSVDELGSAGTDLPERRNELGRVDGIPAQRSTSSDTGGEFGNQQRSKRSPHSEMWVGTAGGVGGLWGPGRLPVWVAAGEQHAHARPEATGSVSDQNPPIKSKSIRAWMLVFTVASVVGAVGFAVANTGVVDDSYQLAESQRQAATVLVQTPDISSETAEFQRQVALAGSARVDVSSQFAEAQRMETLGPVSGLARSEHLQSGRRAGAKGSYSC